MIGQLSVEARGGRVVLELGGASASLTPREAQRFAFELAGAYLRAGETTRSRGGNIMLRPEEPVR
jgi:hypothetical protein